MATLIDTLRSAHEALIAENPTPITVTRTAKVRDGGGFRETTVNVGTFTGRIYQRGIGRSGHNADVSVAGLRDRDNRWGLAAPATMLAPDGVTVIPTDLRAGPNVLDVIEHALGRFEIRGVYPNQDAGEIWGWRADIERVS